MDKQLYLLRHAKAEIADGVKPDHDRALTSRGIEDAQRVGRYFATQSIDPDLILSSTSVRTRQTEREVRSLAPLRSETLFLPELYLAPWEDILGTIRSFSESGNRSILVIGHNPGLEECAGRLCGQLALLATGALAIIGLGNHEFDELGENAGKLRGIITSRSTPLTSD